MVLVVAVSVKYFGFPSVFKGVVTQLPLGFHLTDGRREERGNLSAVE